MTDAKYRAIKKEKERVDEEEAAQARKLREEYIQLADVECGSCVDSDGDTVKYSDHLKIAKKVWKSLKTKVSNPLRAEFNAAFLAAIKAESK
jgi:hypothetical protein